LVLGFALAILGQTTIQEEHASSPLCAEHVFGLQAI